MSLILSIRMQEEVSRTITHPGFLLEIGFDSPLRISSRGLKTWDGKTWKPMSFLDSKTTAAVIGTFEERGESTMEGQVQINTTNREFSIQCRVEKVVGREIRIWILDGDDPDPAFEDPLLVFDGLVRSAELGNYSYATLSVTTQRLDAMFSPREFYNETGGYTTTAAEDKIVLFNQAEYRLNSVN
jgi:hypothetical protein